MCLITTQAKPTIAEQDIIVYKALQNINDELHPPYYGVGSFHYKINKTYATTIMEDKDDRCCYDDLDQVYLNNNHEGWQCGGAPGLFYYGKGYHSANTIERLDKEPMYNIYECIIPAGSEYYSNPTGLMVSNKIIVTGKIARHAK